MAAQARSSRLARGSSPSAAARGSRTPSPVRRAARQVSSPCSPLYCAMSWTPTAILGISQRVGDEGVKFRVMAGTTYVGCCSSMKEAKTLLLDAGVALCSRTKPAEEVELFRAVYPLFADWMPSDYLTHQAVLTKTAARDIRHSLAVYQLWIRGASYDALGKSGEGN